MYWQASNQIASEVNKITEFLDSIRDKKKWAEEGVRSVQTQLRSAHKRMMEVKKGYEAKCKEEINANHQYHQVCENYTMNYRVHVKQFRKCQNLAGMPSCLSELTVAM